MSDGGTAGDSFLQSIFGGGEQDPSEFAKGAKGVLDNAKSGGWGVSEEGGQALLAAIDEGEKGLGVLAGRIRALSEAPMLGSDQYAHDVSQHVQQALDSDDESLVPGYNAVREGLADLYEAIGIARRNYDEADEDARKHLGALED